MSDAPPSPAAWILTAVAAVLLALFTAHYSVHTGDDGFIFLRYAERLAAGRGLGFTDGVPPLEGFSSPLWLLLLTPLVAVGVPSMWPAKLLSAASLGALLAGLWALVRALGGRPWHAALTLALFALLRPPFFWAFSGLETPLAAALLTWTAWGLARGRGAWAVPTGLLSLVRPEGPAMALGVVLVGAFRERRAPTSLELTAALAPSAVLLAARLAVYGDLLPNTFYAKASAPIGEQLWRGIAYVGLVPYGLVGVAAAAWLASDRQPETARRWLAPMMLSAGQLVVVIGGGGDWMWFGRLLVPILPVFVAVVVTAAVRPGPALVRTAAGACGLPLIPFLTPPGTWIEALTLQPLPTVAWQEGQMTPAEAAAGWWIASHGEPGDLVAVNHAGAMPWAAPDQRILDMTGLLDAHIARESPGGLHAKYDVDHVFASEPDWVVLHTRSPPTPSGAVAVPDYWVGETALLQDPRFQEQFEPTGATFAWDWVAAERSWTVVYRRR